MAELMEAWEEVEEEEEEEEEAAYQICCRMLVVFCLCLLSCVFVWIALAGSFLVLLL